MKEGRGKEVNAMEGERVFDRREFMERISNRMDMACKLTRIFLRNCPVMVEEVRRAVSKKDGRAINEAAHALKGAAKAMGAHLLAAAAFKLEVMGRDNDLSAVEEAYALLEKEVERLKPALAGLAES